MRSLVQVGVLVVAVGGATLLRSGPGPGAALAQPAPLDPAVVLATVQQHYANATGMKAGFRQTVSNTALGTTTTAEGTLWVSRPAQLRWDYVQVVRKRVTVTRSVIVDGATSWSVDHVGQQIVQGPAQAGPLAAAVAFLTTGGSLGSQFHVALDSSRRVGDARATVLALTPRQPSAQVAKLYVVVAADGRITQSVVIDASGDTSTFTFHAPDLTAPMRPLWFQVSPSSLRGYALVVAGAGASAPTATGAPTSAGSAATPAP